MLKIPWTTWRTNKSIIKELQEPIRLSVLWEKHIMGYFGLMARRNEENLKKDLLFGKVPDSRARGRFPTRWADTIKARMGSAALAAKKAHDRDKINFIKNCYQNKIIHQFGKNNNEAISTSAQPLEKKNHSKFHSITINSIYRKLPGSQFHHL